jgi:hypothetical protein
MIHSQTLTRRFAQIVAGTQLGAGITGIILSANFNANVSYKPARELLSFLPGRPGLWWSALLALLALTALVALAAKSSHTRTVFSLLCGYWGFWTVLYAAAWFTPGAGPWAPWVALMCVVGNSRPVVAPTLNAD